MQRNVFKRGLIVVLFLLTVFISFASGEEKKYPPYPDVWGYELPVTSTTGDASDRYLQMSTIKMGDGDYMIAYIRKRVSTKQKDGSTGLIKLHFAGILFFLSEKKDFKTDDEYNKFFEKMRKEGRVIENRSITFSDGSSIRQVADDVGRCVLPFNQYTVRASKQYTRGDKDKNILARKNIIYMADKLYKKRPCQLITEPPQKDFYTRIAEIKSPWFVPLEDETFLLVEFDGNTVIRFDKDFNTKSDLLNKKIFVVERTTIEEIRNKLKKQKKYDEQSYYDAIQDYVITQKQGGTK